MKYPRIMGSTQVVRKYKLAAETKALVDALNKGVSALVAISGMIGQADRTLLAARVKSPLKGRVWQSSVLKLIRSFDPLFAEVDRVRGDLRWTLVAAPLDKVVDGAVDALVTPKTASVDYPIADIEFETNPETGEDEITYDLARLKTWATSLKKWSNEAQSTLGKAVKKISKNQ